MPYLFLRAVPLSMHAFSINKAAPTQTAINGNMNNEAMTPGCPKISSLLSSSFSDLTCAVFVVSGVSVFGNIGTGVTAAMLAISGKV